MAFRLKQKLRLASSFVAQELEQTILESGEVVEKRVAQNKKLPDPVMFELKNVLKAGVQPEEVQTAIFQPKSVDADNVVRKYTRKTKTPIKEVNNED